MSDEIVEVVTRVCSVCEETKPITLFVKDNRKPLGFGYRCKACVAADTRERMNKTTVVYVPAPMAGSDEIVQEMPPLPDYSVLRFNYEEIEAEVRLAVQDIAFFIREKERRVLEDVIAIGRQLIRVRELIPRQFVSWIEREFGYSIASAYDFINIAQRYKKFPNIGNFGVSQARLLAAPNVPDEAVELAIEINEARLVDKAPPLLVREVKALIAEHKPPKPPKPPTGRQVAAALLQPQIEAELEQFIETTFTVLEDELAAIAIVQAESDGEDLQRALRDEARAAFERVPDPATSGVLVLLPMTVAQKLHAAVLVHGLSRHLTFDEQDLLREALVLALYPQGE